MERIYIKDMLVGAFLILNHNRSKKLYNKDKLVTKITERELEYYASLVKDKVDREHVNVKFDEDMERFNEFLTSNTDLFFTSVENGVELAYNLFANVNQYTLLEVFNIFVFNQYRRFFLDDEIETKLSKLVNKNRVHDMVHCNHFDFDKELSPLVYLRTEDDHDYHKNRKDIICGCLKCGNFLVELPYYYDRELVIGYMNDLIDEVDNLMPYQKVEFLSNKYRELKFNFNIDGKDAILKLKEMYEVNPLKRTLKNTDK